MDLTDEVSGAIKTVRNAGRRPVRLRLGQREEMTVRLWAESAEPAEGVRLYGLPVEWTEDYSLLEVVSRP